MGELVLGLEAALLRDWRTLQLVAHGPVLALGLVSLDIIAVSTILHHSHPYFIYEVIMK